MPYEKDRAFFKRDLCREDRCVRGTYVKGLSAKDIRFLDIFEGSVRVLLIGRRALIIDISAKLGFLTRRTIAGWKPWFIHLAL